MQKLSISEARQNLPKIAEEVYFKGKSFTLTKRGIPMAKIVKVDNTKTVKHKFKKPNVQKALKSAQKARWIWNEEWKNKSTEEVAKLLAEKAWNSHAS